MQVVGGIQRVRLGRRWRGGPTCNHNKASIQSPLLTFTAPSAAGSPTMGFAVPHHGSLSSGGSPPYGLSPAGPPPPSLFGGGSGGLHAFGAPAPGGLHLGLANGPGRP